MSIGYEEDKLSAIFDEVKTIDQEVNIVKYYSYLENDLIFSLFLSPYEEFVGISLKKKEPILGIGITGITRIICENKKLKFYKEGDKEPRLSIFVQNPFSLRYDTSSFYSASKVSGEIIGYDDYELLEIFDDADLNDHVDRIISFHKNYNEYSFSFSVQHHQNSISLVLNREGEEKPLLNIRLYKIAKIKRYGNIIRLYRQGAEESFFEILINPFLSLQGNL